MANIPSIQFKRSETSGATPDSDSMLVGELALNIADNKIFVKDSDGNFKSLGFYANRDNFDVHYEIDANGNVTTTKNTRSELGVISDSATDNWKTNETINQTEATTKINLFRKVDANRFWDIETDLGSLNGFSVASSAGVAILNYNGEASYAFARGWYNDTFRTQRAYINGADHATLAMLNNYFICQIFNSPVSIGDGVRLGRFDNGRSAYSNEYFRAVRVEFYDSLGNLIVDQAFNTGAITKLDVNVRGQIDDVKSIIMRGDNGSGNPGFNDINFYVNGSTAFPTTSWTTDQKWVGFYRNMGNTGNPSPPNEIMGIAHVSTTSTVNANGMYNIFNPDPNVDMALTNNNDPMFYFFWLHRPRAIAGGTYSNGRERFADHFLSGDIQYHDGQNVLLHQFEHNYTSRITRSFDSHRGVSRVTMIMSGRSGSFPAVNSWNPRLVVPTEESYGSAFDNPEVYAKLTDKATVRYGDGVDKPLEPWKQL